MKKNAKANAAVNAKIVLDDDQNKTTIKKLKKKLTALTGKMFTDLTAKEKDTLLMILLEQADLIDATGKVL